MITRGVVTGEPNEAIEAFVDGLAERGGGSNPRGARGVMAVIQDVLHSELLTLPEGSDAMAYQLRNDTGRVIFVLGPLVVSDNELAYTSIASVPVELVDLVGDLYDPRGVLLALTAGVLAEVSSLLPAYERLYGKGLLAAPLPTQCSGTVAGTVRSAPPAKSRLASLTRAGAAFPPGWRCVTRRRSHE